MNCTENIVYISGKSTKIIHTLTNSAKQSWGLTTKLCIPHKKNNPTVSVVILAGMDSVTGNGMQQKGTTDYSAS